MTLSEELANIAPPTQKVKKPTKSVPKEVSKASVKPKQAKATKPDAPKTAQVKAKAPVKAKPAVKAEAKPAAKAIRAQALPEAAPLEKKASKIAKTLAELVEEEKLQPKQKRPKLPEPKVIEKPEVVVPAPVLKANRPAQRQDRNQRTPEISDPPAIVDESSNEREFFDDIEVMWRAKGEGRPQRSRHPNQRRDQRKPRHQQEALEPSEATPTNAITEIKQPKNTRGAKRQPVVEEIEEDISEPEIFEGEIAVRFRSKKSDEKSVSTRKPHKVSEPEPEPEPVVPTRPQIPIPDDAPQVVVRDGLPTLVRNKRVYPPLAFFASSPDEKRSQVVLSEIRRAAEAGVHLHSHLIEFEVSPNAVDSAVSFAAYMIAQTLEVDPEAQIILRVGFSAPKNWESHYPNARYQTEAGRIAEPSVCDNEYWDVANQCLAEFVRRLRLSEQKDSVLGVHLDRGEWFFPQGVGYDNSTAATSAFRDWLRTRYINDTVAFRAAWFDGQVTFPTVQIPEYRDASEGDHFMRTSRHGRRWVDYHLFLSDSTYSRIANLAYTAKEASEGYFVVGVSYGYTFEWSHPASGHLSLGKLLRTREIDFIAGPPSYRSREPGGDAPFPCPIDSLALNGKLYLSEEDFKTAIGDSHEPDDYNPVIRTPQALEAVHWRGMGASLAHSAGAYWMDLWGNGWLNTSTIWDRGKAASDLLTTRMAAPQTAPDVAVFIDERALAYLVDQQSFALLVQDVRESVLRSGLSAGFFLLSDLAHRDNFPECKLNIFLNAWDIRPEHRMAIKNRLHCDGKVLFWLYCAGMFDNGRESLERAREVTGIAIKPQPFHSRTGTTVLNKRHPLCDAFAGHGLIGGANVDPSYFAIPEEAIVLGEYSQSGLPSFVVRDFNEDPDTSKHWKSVFMGEPYVTPGLLRALAQIANCHIWNYHSDVVHVRAPFLTIHCTGAGQRAIALPRNWEAYNLLSKQWETGESSNVKFTALDGSTHLFLVGERLELEAILAASPADLLHMENLPERHEDSLMADSAMFDVPIMRLDDAFGDASDDVGEDWFLRPPSLEEVEATLPAQQIESDAKIGRRRRKPVRNEKRFDRSNATATTFDDEVGMNIMFRKRE